MSTGTVKQHVNEVIQAESLELGGTAVTSTAAELNILDGVTATAAEINANCDAKNGPAQTLTASGAVTAGVNTVHLDHTSVTIAATIADFGLHSGYFFVDASTEPGVGGDHTLTLTSGTFNGTNTVATFADINDALHCLVDSAGNAIVITNTGSVALSGP